MQLALGVLQRGRVLPVNVPINRDFRPHHVGEVANVLRIDAGTNCLRASGKAKQQVADALQADHELHAGQQFARFRIADLSDHLGHAGIDFHVQAIEFFFALTKSIQ